MSIVLNIDWFFIKSQLKRVYFSLSKKAVNTLLLAT